VKFKEYKGISYAQLAEEVLAKWKKENTFNQSVEIREGKPTFTFYEGPPSANGMPGIHHVMARTVKDIVCRFKTLKGFQVKRKGGWDTHGLPVELQVEKKLGITKEDIGKKISVEEYNKACRESVLEFKDVWDDLTQKMGYWVDLEKPYITFEKEYIESLWYLLKELYKKDLLYKGHTIQPYSPAAGTGLSSHELNQPGCYRDVKDTTIVAQFKVKNKENEFFLAWTTTPWTLPSNAALCVGPNIDYVKIETFNPYTFERVFVTLAKNRVAAYFAEAGENLSLEDYKSGDKIIPWKITESYKGKDLEGIEYEQLLPYVQPSKPAFRVIVGDFVTTEDGTGIVHIAPTFGADDKRVADLAGIPPIVVKDELGNDVPLVDKRGRFVEEVTDFPLHFVKDEYYDELPADHKSVDVQIAIKLKEENRAFKVEKYEHSYPHCWRTDKPILYYPLESWFIKTTTLKDRMVELNKTINWIPKSTGEGRFGNWLENLVDWNLSRSRFWGTPLPIWRTKDGSEEICIGSLAELEAEILRANKILGITKDTLAKVEEELGTQIHNLETVDDLHRPYVDRMILVSKKGQPMFRETDLVDVWFDSGAMPYAQWHYPFENSEYVNNGIEFPADFIAEGVDQTRGWFFTLHALGVLLFDSVAFKNVIANGLVLDKNGNKMSKRLGNAVDPFETINTYGPDAVRWYMISNAQPYENLKFNIEGVAETQRRFFGTFQNTYNFFALYANIDGFKYEGEELSLDKRTESDRWILSKLHSLVKVVDTNFTAYDLTNAARAIQDFVNDDLSNWYVRLNRKRFWVGEYTEDKKAAYQTLVECLITVTKLASPIAPFYFDQVFENLNAVIGFEKLDSVHLTFFPVAKQAYIDENLELKMSYAQRISSLVHSLRKGEKIKVRQPLSKILLPVLNDEFKARVSEVEDLILTEVNIKEIEYLQGSENSVLVKRIKPNFKKLGKEFGKNMKDAANIIAALSQDQINVLEKNNALPIVVNGENYTLTTEDVEISFQDIPGWLVASDNDITVALDITLTEELKKEGISRDIVNRVQNLRKELGMEVQDKIQIKVEKNTELVNAALAEFKNYICTETQAYSLEVQELVPNATALEMDEIILKLEISK